MPTQLLSFCSGQATVATGCVAVCSSLRLRSWQWAVSVLPIYSRMTDVSSHAELQGSV